MSSISVIIPSKNAHNLAACIGAIRAMGETARIIVIDDGVDWTGCDTEKLGIKCVQGAKPFIFSEAVNIGIASANDDDIIVLGDDGLLETQHGFTLLHQAALEHPQYGIISAACNNVGNGNQRRVGPSGLRDEPRTLCFVCVLITRHCINTVGLLDPAFCVGAGLEDDDYSLRTRQAGLKLGVLNACFVDHSKLKSTFRTPGSHPSGGDFRPNIPVFVRKHGVDHWGNGYSSSAYREWWPEELRK